MDTNLSKVIYKIKNCTDYDSLYAMNKDMNSVGLAIVPTTKDKMILCKIVDGKPYAQNIVDDFIFIGCISNKDEQLSDRTLNIIIDFVSNNASGPAELIDAPRKWQNGVRTYGMAVPIYNEDIQYYSQVIID